jgi:hypothetical protein
MKLSMVDPQQRLVKDLAHNPLFTPLPYFFCSGARCACGIGGQPIDLP